MRSYLGVALLVPPFGLLSAQGPLLPVHVQESQKLVAPAPGNFHKFGTALSAWREFVAVGEPFSDSLGPSVGAAYVYRRSGTGLTLVQQLSPSGLTPGAVFGGGIDMEAGWMAVGAACNQVGGIKTGSVLVFRLEAGSWMLKSLLVSSDAEGSDFFGAPVSLSGSTLAVGAGAEDGSTSTEADSGSVYVFERSGTTWAEIQKLRPVGLEFQDSFSSSLALKDDVLCVGAVGDDDLGLDAGAAYVYERSEGMWAQVAKLTASDGAANQQFGSSTAVDEGTIVVGAPWDSLGRGAVYVFERVQGVWTEVDKLSVSSPGVALLGQSTLSLEDNNLVVGAGLTNNQGAAYVFTRMAAGWNLHAELLPSDIAPNDGFGAMVTSAGGITLVSSSADDDGEPESGSAYVFYTGVPATYCTAKTTSTGCVPFVTTLGIPSVSATEPFRIRAHDVLPDEAGLLMYAMKKGNLDFHGGKLCLKPPLVRLLPLKSATRQGTPPCDGMLLRNFNQRIQSGQDPNLTAGQSVRCQWIQRDPPNGFYGDTLTDAVTFVIRP